MSFLHTGPRYLVKTRRMVKQKRGWERVGPWETVERCTSKGDAMKQAAALSNRFETRIFYRGKRV